MLRSRLQQLLSRQQSYKLVDDNEDEREPAELDENLPIYEAGQDTEFSWLVYSIFLLMGVAMLWAWYVVAKSGILAVDILVANALPVIGMLSLPQLPISSFVS